MTRRAALVAGLASLGSSALLKVVPIEVPNLLAGPKAPPLKDWPTLDALAQTFIDTRLTPGLSLSVMRKGVMLYSKGFGVATIDTDEAITPQTTLRIASITKQFTAAAILLLQEQRLLSVNDPLSRFLPDFPRAGEVTLSQLMSHTSGMGDYVNRQDMAILTEAQNRDYTADDVLKLIRAGKPLYRFGPGLGWAYSNSGFTLLSIVVEHLSGLSFADFCEQHLFKPAGLNHTVIDRDCATANTAARGYTPSGRGFDPHVPASPSFLSGAGAMRSTSEDLCQWHAALLGGKVLKADSLTAMLTPALLRNGQPAWEREGGTEPLNYGFGLGVGTVDNHRYCTHGGRINGFTGHLRSFIDEQVTVSILYNCDGGGAARFGAAQKALRVEASRLGLEDAVKV
ncbi:serine hydrolase [Asticcacaulis sp. BYS171W]|uniref:Serine hydrolase n=1 Tax=Asticcacaulis aquaticus TaxID=2984212 RepID=A0ABT5HPD7_9CAUL|nr:serine hydrolase domain-containing protein [Asticcacaulis aquaticus]MDC7681849.1 serine hydrolase [Asticcacaulis aquaticus]